MVWIKTMRHYINDMAHKYNIRNGTILSELAHTILTRSGHPADCRVCFLHGSTDCELARERLAAAVAQSQPDHTRVWKLIAGEKLKKDGEGGKSKMNSGCATIDKQGDGLETGACATHHRWVRWDEPLPA